MAGVLHPGQGQPHGKPCHPVLHTLSADRHPALLKPALSVQAVDLIVGLQQPYPDSPSKDCGHIPVFET